MCLENQSSPTAIDKVRASQDGHTYHETWAARVALGLLYPSTTVRLRYIVPFFPAVDRGKRDATFYALTSGCSRASRHFLVLVRLRHFLLVRGIHHRAT
jgi:hypothetical protein